MLAHIANEAEPFTRQRANEPLLLAVVGYGEAGRVYPHSQCGLRHGAAIPHRIEDIIPGDDPIAMPDEKLQQVENLRFDSHKVSAVA
jgi:hypothetical protein